MKQIITNFSQQKVTELQQYFWGYQKTARILFLNTFLLIAGLFCLIHQVTVSILIDLGVLTAYLNTIISYTVINIPS